MDEGSGKETSLKERGVSSSPCRVANGGICSVCGDVATSRKHRIHKEREKYLRKHPNAKLVGPKERRPRDIDGKPLSEKHRVRVYRQRLRDIRTSRGCKECGEKHPACLDFHHRETEFKLANIAAMVKKSNWTRIMVEVAKCDVICSNCHRKHHYKPKVDIWAQIGSEENYKAVGLRKS